MSDQETWSEQICRNELDVLTEEREGGTKRSKYTLRKGSFGEVLREMGEIFMLICTGLKSSKIKLQVLEKCQGHN